MTSGRFTGDAKHHVRYGMDFGIRPTGYNEIAILAKRRGMRLTLKADDIGGRPPAIPARLARAAGRWAARRLAGGDGPGHTAGSAGASGGGRRGAWRAGRAAVSTAGGRSGQGLTTAGQP